MDEMKEMFMEWWTNNTLIKYHPSAANGVKRYQQESYFAGYEKGRSRIFALESQIRELEEKIKEIEELKKIILQLETYGTKKEKEAEIHIKEKEKEIDELKIQLGEAQQWIDSEPNWKDEYNKEYLELIKLLNDKEKEIEELKDRWHRYRDADPKCRDIEYTLAVYTLAIERDNERLNKENRLAEVRIKELEEGIDKLKNALKEIKKDTDDSIHICYPDYEVIEVSVNGTFIPPGNISEIILPNKRMNCFAMQGTFNGKWNMIYATGAVKIIVIPRSELEEGEKLCE